MCGVVIAQLYGVCGSRVSVIAQFSVLFKECYGVMEQLRGLLKVCCGGRMIIRPYDDGCVVFVR